MKIAMNQLNIPDDTDMETTYKKTDKWMAGLSDQFKDYHDFIEAVFSSFSPEDILKIPQSNLYNLPQIENFDHLIKLLRQKIDQYRPASVNIGHLLTGKADVIETDILERDVEKRLSRYIFNSGELVVKMPISETPQARLLPFIHKFMDYCMVNMNSGGVISVLLNKPQIRKDLKQKMGGMQDRKINSAIKFLENTKIELSVELPLGQGDKISMVIPGPEIYLKPFYLEYQTVGGKKIRRLAGYLLPSFIINLKNNWKFKIYRDPRLFQLPDHQYEILVSIHAKLRKSENFKKGEYAINFNSFLSNDTSFIITAKNVKRDIGRLHDFLNGLINYGALAEYHITERGADKNVGKEWYNDKKYKLTHTKDGKTTLNENVFKNIMYRFIPTDKFISEHRHLIESRQSELKL
jgi:hypothetical protein